MSFSKATVVWILFLTVLMTVGAFAGLPSPLLQDRSLSLQPPSSGHFLGTDLLGRDLLARLLAGGRVSLAIALAATLGMGLVGVMIGAVSGYKGGLVDAFLMRLTELFASIPVLLGALLIMAVVGVGAFNTILALVAFGWPQVARITRAGVLSIRRSGYVEAAWLMGADDRRVLVDHVIPNASAPVAAYLLGNIGSLIMAEAVLSFMGLGVPLPTPSWGNMLAEALKRWPQAPWTALFPGLAITIAVAGFVLTGTRRND